MDILDSILGDNIQTLKKDEESWYCAQELPRLLEMPITRRTFDKDEKMHADVVVGGAPRRTLFVNEDAAQRMIVLSTTPPPAKAHQKLTLLERRLVAKCTALPYGTKNTGI